MISDDAGLLPLPTSCLQNVVFYYPVQLDKFSFFNTLDNSDNKGHTDTLKPCMDIDIYIMINLALTLCFV